MAERSLLIEIGCEDRSGRACAMPGASRAAGEGEAGCRTEGGSREGSK